jgi:hypothetical protein
MPPHVHSGRDGTLMADAGRQDSGIRTPDQRLRVFVSSTLRELALADGHPHLAARLIGATAAARDRTGLTPWPAVSEAERRTIERAQALLPPGEYAAQVASGRNQTIEEALAQALQTPAGQAPAAT